MKISGAAERITERRNCSLHLFRGFQHVTKLGHRCWAMEIPEFRFGRHRISDHAPLEVACGCHSGLMGACHAEINLTPTRRRSVRASS